MCLLYTLTKLNHAMVLDSCKIQGQASDLDGILSYDVYYCAYLTS